MGKNKLILLNFGHISGSTLSAWPISSIIIIDATLAPPMNCKATFDSLFIFYFGRRAFASHHVSGCHSHSCVSCPICCPLPPAWLSYVHCIPNRGFLRACVLPLLAPIGSSCCQTFANRHAMTHHKDFASNTLSRRIRKSCHQDGQGEPPVNLARREQRTTPRL